MKNTITRTWSGVKVKGETSDTVRYGIESFCFLIPFNKTITPSELAGIIKKNHDLTNHRTACIVGELLKVV